MQILLDECMPRAFRRELGDREALTVHMLRWNGLRNGALLGKMREIGLNLLITVDRSLPKQQKLAAGGVAVVVLEARSNRVEHLIPLVPQLRTALNHIQPGQVVRIRAA